MGTLCEDEHIFMIVRHWILLRMRKVQTKVAVKTKSHILCSITFFQKWCHLWDYLGKYHRARQATNDKIQCMHIVCWI